MSDIFMIYLASKYLTEYEEKVRTYRSRYCLCRTSSGRLLHSARVFCFCGTSTPLTTSIIYFREGLTHKRIGMSDWRKRMPLIVKPRLGSLVIGRSRWCSPDPGIHIDCRGIRWLNPSAHENTKFQILAHEFTAVPFFPLSTCSLTQANSPVDSERVGMRSIDRANHHVGDTAAIFSLSI